MEFLQSPMCDRTVILLLGTKKSESNRIFLFRLAAGKGFEPLTLFYCWVLVFHAPVLETSAFSRSANPPHHDTQTAYLSGRVGVVKDSTPSGGGGTHSPRQLRFAAFTTIGHHAVNFSKY